MTVKELEAWLTQVRELAKGYGQDVDDVPVLAILRDGSLADIAHAEPLNGSTGTPVIVLKH